MLNRGYLMAALVTFTLAVGVLNLFISPTYALAGYKSVVAGKAFRAAAGDGWTKFSSTLYFTAASKTADTMWKFTSPSLVSAGSWWRTLGFASDTAAVNMTVTNIAEHDVVYTVTGAGQQRLALAGLGEPTDVTGAATGHSWDGSILTVTTGGAGAVNIHWAVNSANVSDAAEIILTSFPLVAFFLGLGFVKYPSHWRILVQMAIVVAIVTFAAYLFRGWGF